jgi:hypothetical protein
MSFFRLIFYKFRNMAEIKRKTGGKEKIVGLFFLHITSIYIANLLSKCFFNRRKPILGLTYIYLSVLNVQIAHLDTEEITIFELRVDLTRISVELTRCTVQLKCHAA